MKKLILIAGFALGCAGGLCAGEDNKARFPSETNKVEKGEWSYVCVTTLKGSKSETKTGTLTHKGKIVTAPLGTVTNTPVGRFLLFPSKGYSRGWLNTKTHDRPVFKAPEIDVSNISKLEVSYPSGGFVTTNQIEISRLVTAMRKAEPDSTPYDTAKIIRIKFLAGSKVLYSIPAGGPLFNFEGQQYYERSGEFRKVLSELLNQGKKKQNNGFHGTR